MTLEEQLKELIEELDRVHPDGFFYGSAWHGEDGLPDFATAQNGNQRHFSLSARKALRGVAAIMHENDPAVSSIIELESYALTVRQCVADLHAEGKLDASSAGSLGDAQKNLTGYVKRDLSKIQLEFTHYFPAWTLGMEKENPFPIGPVTIFSREHWIDAVDFPPNAIAKFINLPEENAIMPLRCT
jgi:hypothetical protein